MMSRFAILKPVIALFWSARSGMLLAGAVLAATTVLASVCLAYPAGLSRPPPLPACFQRQLMLSTFLHLQPPFAFSRWPAPPRGMVSA